MSIYHTAIDRTPFTYFLGWSHLNTYYYGVRYAKGCHPSNLWTTYFTSSEHVSKFREIHGEPNIIEVRKVFTAVKAALIWEHHVLKRMKVNTDNRFLNISLGFGNCFSDHTGKKQSPEHIEKRANARRGSKHPESAKKIISDKAKNRVIVEDNEGNRFKVYKNDPRFISGELKTPKTGIFCAIDTMGNKFSITKDDPRFISGELIALTKGRIAPNRKLLSQEEIEEQNTINDLIKQYKIPLNKKGGGDLVFIRKTDHSSGKRVHPLLFEHYYKYHGYELGKRNSK